MQDYGSLRHGSGRTEASGSVKELVRRRGGHYRPRPMPEPASRPMRVIVALLVAVLSLGGIIGIAAEPAAAQIGAFDAIDGVIDTHESVSARSDLVKSGVDNSYTQGAKEDDVCPTVEAGSIPPSKNDFATFYEGFAGNVLYLAFERTDTNGTATIDFELNQSSTDCGNGVNKLRTVGDLLITFDFQGGSAAGVPIQIRTWTGTEWSAPTLLAAGTAEASIGADLLTGELAIDLVKAGIFQVGTCVSFASGFAKSRASSAFNSELKDLVSPINKTISNCAGITVIKEASVASSTAFPFTFDPPSGDNVNFDLYDDGSASPDATPDRRTFAGLTDVNGSYVVSEVEPAVTPGAWELTDIVCSGGTVTEDLANNRVTIVPGGAVNVTCTFVNTFDPAPTIVVQKTARPTTINEPGGAVAFDVVVTNLSKEAVTLTDLTDKVGAAAAIDVFGISGTDCSDNVALAAADTDATGGADTYHCTFTLTVAGNAGDTRTDVVTATVVDAEGDTATDDDDATVTIADVLPIISLTKTANVASVPETGGPVIYRLVVTNLSRESVTLTELTDTVEGTTIDILALGGATTCVDNVVLQPADATAGGGADTYACTFTRTVTGNADTTHTNTAEATVVDDDGSSAKASDVENVLVTDNPPTLSVLKTAQTPTIAEPGGPVTFDVLVTNLSPEAVTLTSLVDSVFGDLTARPNSTCATGGTLTATTVVSTSDSYTCTFTLDVTGNAGSTHDNRVDATVVDDDSTTATAFDTERVTITNVAPSVAVTKTAAPASVGEPGGPVTYTVVVRNLSAEPVTLTALTDTDASGVADLLTAGNSTCDGVTLAASDGVAGGADTTTCTFTGTVTGNAGSTHVDVVEATVVDDDQTSATAEDDAVVTVTDVLPGIQVVKTASPTVVRVGDLVTYTYAVTTTTSESLADVAVTDDKCTPVAFVDGDTDGDDLLDAGEIWNFRCTSTLAVDTVNVATANGQDDEGNETTDTDDESVDVIHPALAVDKTADRAIAGPGDAITYTYVVTNPGDGPLEPVTITDDKCDPVTFVSGDADGDAALDPGEAWRYTCSVTATVAGALVNVVVVTGTPAVGPDVSATDTATVSVEEPVVLNAVVTAPPAPAAVAPAVAPAAVPVAVAPLVAARPTLPRTGSDTDGPLRAALVLLVVGGLALIPEHLRRRRSGVVRLER